MPGTCEHVTARVSEQTVSKQPGLDSARGSPERTGLEDAH